MANPLAAHLDFPEGTCSNSPSALLGDVRARISFLKRDLGNLLASLPSVADTQNPRHEPGPRLSPAMARR